MADQIPSLGCGARAARLLVLFAALAGLFAMHGLTDHGAPPPTVDVAVHQPMGHGVVHDAAMAASPETGEATDVAVGTNGHGGHAGLGLAGLCLAVLGLAGVARWLLAGRTRVLAAWFRLPTPAIAPVTPTRHRGADPPDLVRLQVHRC